MPLIDWHDRYRIGIPGVDHEHRELIDLINRLFDALGANTSTGQIADFLSDIYGQISAHFALEEATMRQRRYARLSDHKRDHERLLDEIRDIMDDFDRQPASYDPALLATRLERWFSVHFQTFDADLHHAIGDH